jgi:hypothetical protein
MPYVIQGDEFEIDAELQRRLAEVLAEAGDVVLADATRRVRLSFGIFEFGERAEADRVAARFTEMGFANFVLDELLPVPRMRLLGAGATLPEEPLGLLALGRLLLEERHKVTEAKPRVIGISYVPIPLPGGQEESTVSREQVRYQLDLLTREQHWRIRSGMLTRIVDAYASVDVSEAYLSAGVRSLSRSDRDIPTFHREEDWDRYVTWLYQLRYA